MLIQCPECKKQISDNAITCPECGYQIKKELRKKKLLSQKQHLTEVLKEKSHIFASNNMVEDYESIEKVEESNVLNAQNECEKENITDNEKENKEEIAVTEQKENREQIFNENPTQNAVKNKRKLLPIAIISLVAIAIIFLISGNSLNKDEQLAYDNVMRMKKMMKDPDSFRLYDEMLLFKYHGDDGSVEYVYTIFKYGGANSYGGIITDEAIFKDNKYIMDYADEPDKDDDNYMEQLGTQADIALAMLGWDGSYDDGDAWEIVELDIEKIKKEMGLD